jgi:hypothetical protein
VTYWRPGEGPELIAICRDGPTAVNGVAGGT